MKVSLERTITDHVTHRNYNIYRREDGKFWVLGTPTNPGDATAENIFKRTVDTRQEALDLCTRTRP